MHRVVCGQIFGAGWCPKNEVRIIELVSSFWKMVVYFMHWSMKLILCNKFSSAKTNKIILIIYQRGNIGETNFGILFWCLLLLSCFFVYLVLFIIVEYKIEECHTNIISQSLEKACCTSTKRFWIRRNTQQIIICWNILPLKSIQFSSWP